jgi:hydroxymethylbilane synthase
MAYLILIGTRGSRLALWQANHVASLLERVAAPEMVEIQTAGDQVRDVPLSQIGGEGVFTKELQRALLDRRISMAVHSLKDLPTAPVEGLVLAAVLPRGPTGDVFISHRYPGLDSLPQGAVVATSSPRRQAQILHRRPDLRLLPIRGNVETRLRKLDEGGFDALVLAQAGLERLGLAGRITEILDPAWMLPAVGQGALGIECLADEDHKWEREFAAYLDHSPTHQAVLAERALLRTLQGGCQVPLGASATLAGDTLTLRAAVLDTMGKCRLAGELSGSAERAEELGCRLADDLLQRGARELLSVVSDPQT